MNDCNSNNLLDAVRAGNRELTRCLVENGANVNMACEPGSVLSLALFHGWFDIAKYLIENGALVTCEAFRWPILRGNRRIVRYLLDHEGDPNSRDIAGMTPLMLSCLCERNGVEIASMLLRAGADPNLKDGNGLSSIDHAKKRACGEHSARREIARLIVGFNKNMKFP